MEYKNSQTTCPYCKGEFAKPPQRKSKCPLCGNAVYVKRRPDGDAKELVTEAQSVEIEKIWDERQAEKDEEFWIERLECYGFSKSEYQTRKTEWLKEQKFKIPLRDFIWHTFTAVANSYTGDYNTQRSIYMEMARFLTEENKNPELPKRLAFEAELNGLLQNHPDATVIIRAISGTCAACSKDDGHAFSVQQALAEMPLPHQTCDDQYGYCRCLYTTQLKLRDYGKEENKTSSTQQDRKGCLGFLGNLFA